MQIHKPPPSRVTLGNVQPGGREQHRPAPHFSAGTFCSRTSANDAPRRKAWQRLPAITTNTPSRPLTGPPRAQAGRVRAGGGLSRLGRPQAKPAGAAAVPLTGPTSSPREPAPLASDTPLTQVRAAAPPVPGDEVPVAPPAEAPPAPPVRPAALPRQQRGPPLPLTFLRQRSPPMVAPEDQTPTPARTFSSAAGAKAAAGTSALARRPRPVAVETGLRTASPPSPASSSIFRSEGPWGGGAFLTLCAHNFIERSEIKAKQNAGWRGPAAARAQERGSSAAGGFPRPEKSLPMLLNYAPAREEPERRQVLCCIIHAPAGDEQPDHTKS